MFKDITDRFSKEVWSQDVHKLSRSRQIALYWVRLFDLLLQDLTDGYLSQRAASLAYTSILSVVPLMAFSFALLKGFGFQNKFEPLLRDIFSSMGPQGPVMSADIIDFMNNVRAGVLGSVGLVLLLFTVLSLTRKVETAFNFVWRVRESRSLTKGFVHYLGILMIGPLLLVVVAGVTASFSNQAVVDHLTGGTAAGVLVFVVAKAISLLIIVGTFTFLYMVVPYTHVQFRSAVSGGLLAGVLWELTRWVFTTLSSSTATLATVYAAFAMLMIFFVWLYVSWVIVLLGTHTSFYVQNPDLVRHGLRRNETGGRTFERVALHIMYIVGRAYAENTKPWSREQLARYLHLPTDIILDVIDRLQHSGLVIRVPSRRNIHRYVPARDMSAISLRDIVMAVRRSPRSGQDPDKHIKAIGQVEELMLKMDQAIDGVMGGLSLKEFIEAGEPAELSGKTVLRARH
jgi:membrane protein